MLTTLFVQILKRHLASGVAVSASSWLLSFTLNSSYELQIAFALTGMVLGVFFRSSMTLFAGIFLAVIAWVMFLLLANAFWPSYQISGSAVLVIAILASLIFVLLFSRALEIHTSWADAATVLSLVGILTYLFRNSRDWTSENAFDSLVRNGEDNAAWLLALSQSVVDGETQLNPQSATSGGPGTGVFINIIRQLMDVVGQSSLVSSADNGLVLMRSYVLLGVLLAFVWNGVAYSYLRERDALSRGLFSVLASVLSVVFMQGLATVGHFSAVVAVLFLSLAVFFQSMRWQNIRGAVWYQRILVASALVAAGQSWFPLTGLALLYVVIVTVAELLKRFTFRPSIQQLRALGFFIAVFIPIGFLLYNRVFSLFLKNVTSLDYITYNLTLAGGYSTVNPWIVVLSFVGGLWWAFSRTNHSDIVSTQTLVAVLVFPIVLLFTWSYFLSPFTPQYGAWKYLYVGAAVMAPLAVIVVGEFVPTRLPASVVRVFPVMIFAFVTLFSPPWNNVRWADNVASDGYAFSNVIVQELRRDPKRAVACLETSKDDSGYSYIAYLCSRMALGLGGFDSSVHRVWTAGNICTIGPEQATSEFTREFQENLTVILFDGTRTSSFAGCQAPLDQFPNGWLTSIDWSVVRKVDTSGKVVEMPATKFSDK